MSETNSSPAKHKTFYIMVYSLLIMLGVSFLCTLIFSRIMANFKKDEVTVQNFRYHYAFISDPAESEFNNAVFEGAKEEGESQHIYVERMEDILATEYTTTDLLRMAVNSSVDGVIFYGDDTPENMELIRAAVEKGMAVVTMRRDLEESERQCFVGVSSYDLGQEYGKQISHIWQEDPDALKISVLIDDTTAESMQSLFSMGLMDELSKSLGEDKTTDITMQKIDNSDAFSAEEAIRDIFLEENNLPDILLCLNSINTECAYQAAVDYNHVGDVKILGYYASDTILEAVSKQIVFSTIQVDTNEIGRNCVDVLTEYLDLGYASAYVPVSMHAIDKAEAERLLREEAEHEAAGN